MLQEMKDNISINREKMDANQPKMEARINVNNEKFDVLRSTLVSRMDVFQPRTEADQEEIIAKTEVHQERMGPSMNPWRNKMNRRQETTEAYPERTEARIQTGQEPFEAEIKTCEGRGFGNKS
jgi:hypothetical protein